MLNYLKKNKNKKPYHKTYHNNIIINCKMYYYGHFNSVALIVIQIGDINSLAGKLL